jgi:hypothetical protein
MATNSKKLKISVSLLKEKIISMIEHYKSELNKYESESNNYEWCHLLICELEGILDNMIFHRGKNGN